MKTLEILDSGAVTDILVPAFWFPQVIETRKPYRPYKPYKPVSAIQKRYKTSLPEAAI